MRRPRSIWTRTTNSAARSPWMNETNKCLFITGKAGTGKSTLLDYFCLHTAKRPVVPAPHWRCCPECMWSDHPSLFQFLTSTSRSRKSGKKDIRPRNAKLYANLETIIIDEISMVRADSFGLYRCLFTDVWPA